MGGYLFTEWGFGVGFLSWTFELDFRVGLSSWTFEFDFRVELSSSVGLSSWIFELEKNYFEFGFPGQRFYTSQGHTLRHT